MDSMEKDLKCPQKKYASKQSLGAIHWSRMEERKGSMLVCVRNLYAIGHFYTRSQNSAKRMSIV